jgi:hypothetical protein
MELEWKLVPGYQNQYEVSNYGHVRSLHSNKLLRQTPTHSGYLTVCLHFANRQHKTVRVHKLVAEAFCDKEPYHDQVNHLDGNKRNNHYQNLEWSNSSSNNQHAYDNNLRSMKGSRHNQATLTEQDVNDIRRALQNGVQGKTLAHKYDVCVSTISQIKNNRTWTHV